MIMIFLTLFFFHLLADFPFQGEFLSKMKEENMIFLSIHASIWTGVISIVGHFIGFQITISDVIILFIVHLFADYLKANKLVWYKNLDPLHSGLIIDQLIHVCQLILFIFLNI